MRVAVGIIVDAQQRILITRRPLHASQGGMWEFPGGKLEEGETAAEALIREIKEEVDLDVQDSNFLGEINSGYLHHAVVLLVFEIRSFHGEAKSREMQMDLRWVELNQLQNFEFPEANQQIMALIKAGK